MEKMNFGDEISKLDDFIREDIENTENEELKKYKSRFLKKLYWNYEDFYNGMGKMDIEENLHDIRFILIETNQFTEYTPELFTYKEIKQIRKINSYLILLQNSYENIKTIFENKELTYSQKKKIDEIYNLIK